MFLLMLMSKNVSLFFFWGGSSFPYRFNFKPFIHNGLSAQFPKIIAELKCHKGGPVM